MSVESRDGSSDAARRRVIQEWIGKLLMLIKNPERRQRIGESGRKTVERQYSYRATIPELLRVFSEVMGRASTLVAPRPGIAREEP